jgi:RNA polymerase subunit RPABC4/transcription elongation factor Spt4
MLPTQDKGLFEDYHQCTLCGRRLPQSYKEEYCPACQDIQLLHNVKDFIRENDVNEYQVADHFQIPVKQVKEWIREGRIEYRMNRSGNAMSSVHCQRCGAPVSFGTLCPQCLKLLNSNVKGYHVQQRKSSSDRMRFLDNAGEED